MSLPVLARWLAQSGILASGIGIALEFNLDRIVNPHISRTALNIAAEASVWMTVLGLLAVLVGGVIWAWRVPFGQLLLAALSAGFLAFLLEELGQINMHGPTAIFIFVVLAGSLGSALMVLIAGVRFAVSRLRPQS